MTNILDDIYNLTLKLYTALNKHTHTKKIRNSDIPIRMSEIPNLGCYFYAYDETGFINKRVTISLLKRYYMTLSKLLKANDIPVFPHNVDTHSNVFHSNLNLIINKQEITELIEKVMSLLIKEDIYFINGVLLAKEALHDANVNFEYHNLLAYISYSWDEYKNLAPITDIVPVENIFKYLQNRGLLLNDVIAKYYNFYNKINEYDINDAFRKNSINIMDEYCKNLSDEDKLYIELNKGGIRNV